MTPAIAQPFPRTPDEVEPWAEKNARPVEDAERRYAHYLSMLSVADSPLASQVVVHGAAALCFFYGLPRTPRDLDFFVDGYITHETPRSEKQRVAALVGKALSKGLRKFCPDFDARKEQLQRLVNVDLFGPDRPTAFQPISLTHDGQFVLKVATLQVNVARKALALFRRKIGEGYGHCQDVYDIAYLYRLHGEKIGLRDIFHFFVREGNSVRWRPGATARTMLTPRIRELAEKKYATLSNRTFAHFIPFDAAWEIAWEFYDAMLSSDPNVQPPPPPHEQRAWQRVSVNY
jgi:hypothetical protein